MVAHTASRGYLQVLLVCAKISTLWSDSLSTNGSFDASCRHEGAWVTHECFLRGVVSTRRERFGRCWDLAVVALHVAGTSQETLWASVGPCKCSSGRCCGLAGNRVGVAGASQKPLWASLGAHTARSGRRWGVAGAALIVAGARRELSWCRLDLAGDALGVAGVRRGRAGRR